MPLSALAGVLWLGLVIAPELAAAATAPTDFESGEGWSVALAPFGGDTEPAERIGDALAEALASRAGVRVERLDAPAGLPEASSARRLAARAGVESLVVGRVELHGEAVRVEAELRSGHSGGAVARVWEQVPNGGDEPSAVEALAASLLQAMGWQPPSEPVAVAASPPTVAEVEATSEADSDGGAFGLGAARRDQPIKIVSEILEVIENPDGRHFIFTRNVVVTQADVRLTSDRLDAYYPAGSSQPERLVARGHVRVSQSDRRAQCDQATYARETQQVVCTGHAVFVHGCDRVRGDEIRLDLDHERVRVMGAPSVVIRPESDEPRADDAGCAQEGRS